jgi:ABC-type lipoprotein release transport system permease subunit
MNVIASISFRNLVRQKRRNLLLGTAIAFGTMILVLANAFSAGISDVIFNKIMRFVAGHVAVTYAERGNMYTQVFRDGDRLLDIVKKTAGDVEQFSEAIGVMARGIGNGRSDNLIIVGIDLSARISKKDLEETMQNFTMVKGSFLDVADSTKENPVIMTLDKANYLNLKMGDVLRIRVTDINGQTQAARMTIVGLYKPSNAFMGAVTFGEMHDVKGILGYGPHEIGQLYLTIKDPKKRAVRLADSIHAALAPAMAVVPALDNKGSSVPLLGYRADSMYTRELKTVVRIASGDSAAAYKRDGVMAGTALAARLNIHAGDTFGISWPKKYGGMAQARLPVKAIFSSADSGISNNLMLLNEYRFFDLFYHDWPAAAPDSVRKLLPDSAKGAAKLVAAEWILLDRCKTTEEVRKRYKEIIKHKYAATTVDVQTMYETASDVLKLEAALNMITLIAVMVLFFIILIGVVNTLRMTIRERTREIGTVRAIGMQKKDVRNSFILETAFLTLFASAAGTVLGFAAMALLSIPKFSVIDNPIGMLLVGGHLHFVPTLWGIIGYNALILAIAVATSWFPARRAANMAPTAALRHYE